MIGKTILYAILVASTIYHDIDSFRKAVEAEPKPVRSSSLRFRYTFGFWPELGLLESDSLLDSQFKGISDRLGLVGMDMCDTAQAFVCGRLDSEFLRSQYLLVWIRTSLSMLGSFPPTTFFVTKNEKSKDLTPQVSKLMRLASDFEDLLSQTIPSVVKDARVKRVTRTNCREAALDLITACCPEHPIVFLDSAFDIYAFSNAIEDSTFWEIAATDDSLIALLTSYRLEHVGSNSYFATGFRDINYGWEDFASADTIVNPLEYTEANDGSLTVTTYTWSGCVLVKWRVEFNKKAAVKIEHEVLDMHLGFGFMYY